MVLAHNEGWDGDSALECGRAQARLLEAKEMKKNFATGFPIPTTRSAMIRMCNLRAFIGKDKAKHLLRNPSFFVTFRHKNIEIQHKNAFFCTLSMRVASSERSHRRDCVAV